MSKARVALQPRDGASGIRRASMGSIPEPEGVCGGSGEVTGYYQPSSGDDAGFIARPVPEPSLALLAPGLTIGVLSIGRLSSSPAPARSEETSPLQSRVRPVPAAFCHAPSAAAHGTRADPERHPASAYRLSGIWFPLVLLDHYGVLRRRDQSFAAKPYSGPTWNVREKLTSFASGRIHASRSWSER